ncbi:hypothetical protein TorRG33x02_136360 [Trema orientale]|uniref:Uncharacterized protein n=1 Tax=Trema orientale TaxID=63057 RepID=A0A2P5EYG9_TREOI|nr:hypothetical protein TorRG33x02_136360 [Trema orientale]
MKNTTPFHGAKSSPATTFETSLSVNRHQSTWTPQILISIQRLGFPHD